MYRHGRGKGPANAPAPQPAPPQRRFELFTDDQFDMRLMLVGRSGTGKSSVGNTILGRNCFPTTTGFVPGNRRCFANMVLKRGKNVRVVDTCGIFDTSQPQEDVRTEASKAFALAAPGPHVFLLVIPADRYTKEHQDTVGILQRMFPKFFDYTIVVFTKEDELLRDNRTMDAAVTEANTELQKLLTGVQRRYIAFNNREAIASKKEERVLQLLDMAYDVTQMHKEHFYDSAVFAAAESFACEQETRIREEIRATPEGRADILSILMRKIEDLTREMPEQGQRTQQPEETVEETTSRQGPMKTEQYLTRCIILKEIEKDKVNLLLRGRVDPFPTDVMNKLNNNFQTAEK